jgi:ParB family transcriptional regulator, chromosome partitioning protein
MNQPKELPLEQIHTIRLEDIHISSDTVRLNDPTTDLVELAASIKQHGILQPVLLLGEYGKPPYDLISGQRRFLAHEQILKAPTIRAVFAGKLSKTDAVVRSLVENLQRVELNYEDTAKAITYLYEKLGKDEQKVQKATGLSLRKIRDFILIEARATPKMKALLNQHKVSLADVKRAIRAAQDNLPKAEDLLDLIIKHKPTKHQKQRIVMYGERNKGFSAERILKDAMKPHIEQNMIISLSEDLLQGLEKARESLSMEPEELAAKVLSDWLRGQGFVK